MSLRITSFLRKPTRKGTSLKIYAVKELSEFFRNLREKYQYERPDPTRLHDAFERLTSLQPLGGLANGLLHHAAHPFYHE